MEIPDSPSSKVLPWIIPALYAAITVHELGHLVAGKFAGMEAGGLVIGGIVILKSGERWVLRFDRWFIFGGLAKPLPLKGTFRPARFAWMVAGGPIASLLLLVSCEFSILRLGDGAGDWTGSLFWAALFTVFASLIPFSTGLQKSTELAFGSSSEIRSRHAHASRSLRFWLRKPKVSYLAIGIRS